MRSRASLMRWMSERNWRNFIASDMRSPRSSVSLIGNISPWDSTSLWYSWAIRENLGASRNPRGLALRPGANIVQATIALDQLAAQRQGQLDGPLVGSLT